MWHTTLNIQPYLAAAAFTAIFELFLSSVIFESGSRAITNIFITKKLQKGRSVTVGKVFSLLGLCATIILGFLNQSISVAEIGIRPIDYGEARWDPVLSAWQEVEIINDFGMESIQADSLFREGMAEVINNHEICGLKLSPMIVKTFNENGVPQLNLQRVGTPTNLYIRSSTTPLRIVWQHNNESIVFGKLYQECSEIGTDEDTDVSEITSKMLEDALKTIYEPVVCVLVGDKKVYRKKDNWRKEKYFNVFGKSEHIGQIITRDTLRRSDIEEFNGGSIPDSCLKELKKLKFLKSGLMLDEEIWKKYRDVNEPEYVIFGRKTELRFEYFIPVMVAAFISVFASATQKLLKEVYRLSNAPWIVRLLIDHYEKLNNCANPERTREIGITDTDPYVQHLGISRGNMTVRRNFEKDLKGSKVL